ncbi:MAG TPA: hypothetical protein VEK35_05280 [Roseiarcus sp.]|nr:hypothetical protein [Roseiarcus sp.]
MSHVTQAPRFHGRLANSGLNPNVLWPIAVMAGFAVWAQSRWGVCSDTSWLLTVGEQTLAGKTPYVDILEVNPPASILLYLPAVAAARLFGATPEFMADLLCLAAIAASLALAGAIVIRGALLGGEAVPWLAAYAGAALFVLPAHAFDQRDHVALIVALPCLASLAVRAAGGRVEPLLAVAAGLGAGVAMSIKPHFALLFAPNVLYLAQRGGWRTAFVAIEPYVALTVFALYGAAAVLFFPAFFQSAAPLLRDIYLPSRLDFASLVIDPLFFAWIGALALVAITAGRRLETPLVAVPTLASLGAMGAFLIQGKDFPYQSYPALALAVLALGASALEWRERPRGPIVLGCAIAIIMAPAYLALARSDAHLRLEEVVGSVAAHPKVIAIAGGGIGVGHPLTRRVHGVWAGRLCSLWITDLSSRALLRDGLDEAAKARYRQYLSFDRQTLVADIVANKPDVVLIAGEQWKAWAFSHPDVAAALADYAPQGEADGVTVYARAKPRPQAST